MRSLAKNLRSVALLGVSAIALLPGMAAPQSAQSSGRRNAERGQLTSIQGESDSFDLKMHARQLKTLNALRQQRLVADADKLLLLASELKDETGDPAKAANSAKAIKKADEIEKLARSVREKMKASP